MYQAKCYFFILLYYPTLNTVNLCGTFVAGKKMKKVEIIQKQSLRSVYNDYSSTYQELLDKAHRPPMFTNRLQRMVSFVDKCIKGKCPVY